MKAQKVVRRLALLAVVFFSASPVLAAEWHVDASASAGGDGSASAPYATIQAAIDAESTQADDTILVAPGVYDTGDTVGYSSGTCSQRTRVHLTKRLTLKSTEGRDVTHIVGEIGAGEADTDGSGGSVQCVYVSADALGSVIEGFTLRDGAAAKNSRGGGAVAASANNTSSGKNGFGTDIFVLAYCSVSNCVSSYGSVRGGLSVATLFKRNGGENAAAVYGGALYNCIVAESVSGAALADCGPIVNSTSVNNYGGAGIISYSPHDLTKGNIGCYWNFAAYGSKTISQDPYGFFDTALTDGSSHDSSSSDVEVAVRATEDGYRKLVMSAMTGDYRPVAGGRLAGHGKRECLSFAFIPEDYRMRDFNGDPIAEDAPVPIGALLPEGVPASAGLCLSSPMRLNGGDSAYAYHCHYTDVWPRQAYVTARDADAATFIGVGTAPFDGVGSCVYFKGKYDGVWLTLPPLTTTTNEVPLTELMVSVYQAKAEKWVDCNTNYDGTAAKPYKTIQDAVNAASTDSGTYTWIHVRPGVYDEGGNSDRGYAARVSIPGSKHVYIESTDGAAVTSIVGAPDPDYLEAETYPGCGGKACRCVGVGGSSFLGLCGFTFTQGYSGSDGRGGNIDGGAIVFGSPYHQVLDSVFTDNHAQRDSCINNGWAIRCLFKQNVSVRGVVAFGNASSCVFVDNGRAGDMNIALYSGASANNITVYEPFRQHASGVGYFNNNNAQPINSCFLYGGRLDTPHYAGGCHFAGCVGWGCQQYGNFSSEQELRQVDPRLVSPERGNLRPLANSPLLNGGTMTYDGFGAGRYVKFTVGDFENRPVVASDGSVAVGAYAVAREGVTLYVNANGGNDAWDGQTPETAKETLAAAMDEAFGGDTVVALPGTYAKGEGLHVGAVAVSARVEGSDVPKIRSRVVVPAGVTLVSRDGAAATTIEGAAATDPDAYGRGADAMRGVFLEEGAVLRGFTVRKGRANADDDYYYDDALGGGVLGRSIAGCLVEDCVLTDNCAPCGGAGSYVTFRRCRILNNRAGHYGSASRHGALEGCYVAGNLGRWIVDVFSNVIGCTFSGNTLDGSTSTILFANGDVGGQIVNVLCVGKISDNMAGCANSDFRNCVFPSNMTITHSRTFDQINQEHTGAELEAMYANGVPLSLEAPSVDKGCVVEPLPACDLAGNQRIMNGTIDIGAFEADWRGAYAAALSRKGVTVTDVTASVTMTDGHPQLHYLDSMSLEWASSPLPKRDWVVRCVLLRGTGTLTVTLNGEVLTELNASGEVRFDSALPLNRLTFSYRGDGVAYVDGLSHALGMMMFVH